MCTTIFTDQMTCLHMWHNLIAFRTLYFIKHDYHYLITIYDFLWINVQRLISSLAIFFEYLPSFKLTVSDQKGKSISRELKDNDANVLLGLQVGQETDASILGLQGKIKITGGSDKSGVAMRGDVAGVPRKRVLLSKGVGLQNVKKGLRKRKLVRGNIISEEIYQINCK